MTVETVYSANPPMFRNRPIFFLISLALCAVAVGFLILIYWYVRTKAEKLTISADKVEYRTGLLSKSHDELKISSIRSTKVQQSFIQRIFGTGNVAVYTAGDNPEFVIRGYPKPNKIRELLSGG